MDIQNVMTVDEVAEYLRISKALVYRLKAEGKIKSISISHCLRFRKSDIEEYVAGL